MKAVYRRNVGAHYNTSNLLSSLCSILLLFSLLRILSTMLLPGTYSSLKKEFIQRPTTDKREGRNAEKQQRRARSVVPGGASNSKCQASVRGDGGQTRRADLTDEVTELAANRATTSAPSDEAGLIIRRLRHNRRASSPTRTTWKRW